jgi:hypothetical protein
VLEHWSDGIMVFPNTPIFQQSITPLKQTPPFPSLFEAEGWEMGSGCFFV